MDQASLRHFFIFDTLSEGQWLALLQRSSIQCYPPDAVLFLEGDRSDRFSIVMEGELEIIKSFGTEVERIINVLEPGSVLGETSLFSIGHIRTATARARSALKMFEIPVDHFQELVRRTPELAYDIMQVLTGRIVENERNTINELRETNRKLVQSLKELQEAQEQLILKERMQTELAMARQIQESMLPDEIPSLPGWNLSASWQPAREVSGDFYDFIPLPDGRLALVIGDVTDKGVPAALVMTVTRSVLRTAALQAASPGALLGLANDLLAPQMPMSMFVTCEVAYLDPLQGTLEMANAGHCLPLFTQGRKISELNVRGMALGLFPGQNYPPIKIQMQPGDRLLLFSDGFTEAHNRQGKQFGSQSLQALLNAPSGQPVIPILLQQLAEFTGPLDELQDDLTLLVVERLS